MSTPLPVTIEDVKAARAAARGRHPGDPGAGLAAARRSGWAGRSGSSARTSSGPARSRSAAPTSGSRGSPRTRRRAAWSRRAPATTPRASRSRRRCSGIRSTVFMPEGAPIPKVQATRAYGAEVRFHGSLGRRGAAGGHRRSPTETGAVLIHPFDHPDIVAGQGTVGLEILEQVPGRAHRSWSAPAAAGCWRASPLAVKSIRPDVRVVGVQAEGAAAYPASLAAGRPGAAGADVDDGRRHRGRLPGRRCRSASSSELVDDVVTVSEESLSRALLLCLERAKLVVEPAGAAGVAALLDDPRRLRAAGGRSVLSGGNIDPLLLAAGAAARPGRGRAVPVAAGRGSPTGRARWRSCWPRWPRRTRTCSRSSTCGPTRGCGWTRSRCGCSWRPAARSTARACSTGCGRRATRSCSADRRTAP